MNKGDLVAELAARSELSNAAATRTVNALMDIITEQLQAGISVALPGFGTFSVSDRAEREGRNPATGETITIAAAKVPKFSAGNTLKAAVNPGKAK